MNIFTLRVWTPNGEELGAAGSDSPQEILTFGRLLGPTYRRLIEFLPPIPQEGRTFDWDDFERMYGGQAPIETQ